jgi:hypothetical protein
MKLYEEIETIAYDIWEKSGRVHGKRKSLRRRKKLGSQARRA